MSDESSILCTADICPHGTSSSLCEWCLAKVVMRNQQNIIREYEMREDLLKKENAKLKELVREAIEPIRYVYGGIEIYREWLARAKELIKGDE